MGALGTAVFRRFRAVAAGVTLAAGGFVVANVLQIPLLVVLGMTSAEYNGPVGYSIATVLQSIAFISVVVFYTRSRGFFNFLKIRWPTFAEPRKLLRDVAWGVGGAVVLYILSQVVGLALQNVGAAPGTNYVERVGRETPSILLLMIVLSFLATGPGEEILFRGGIQGRLREVFSPVSAIVVSSLLFGLAHTTAVVGTTGIAGVAGYILTTFVLGAILGSLYEMTSNLLIPMFVHAAYNAALFFVLYVSVTT